MPFLPAVGEFGRCLLSFSVMQPVGCLQEQTKFWLLHVPTTMEHSVTGRILLYVERKWCLDERPLWSTSPNVFTHIGRRMIDPGHADLIDSLR